MQAIPVHWSEPDLVASLHEIGPQGSPRSEDFGTVHGARGSARVTKCAARGPRGIHDLVVVALGRQITDDS